MQPHQEADADGSGSLPFGSRWNTRRIDLPPHRYRLLTRHERTQPAAGSGVTGDG